MTPIDVRENKNAARRKNVIARQKKILPTNFGRNGSNSPMPTHQCWFHYIDNIFLQWERTHLNLDTFFTELNEYSSSLKFTVHVDLYKIHFLNRTISEGDTLKNRLDEMDNKLANRGLKALARYKGEVGKIVNRHRDILKVACSGIAVFQNPPLLSFKRAQFLKDRLVRADVGAEKVLYDVKSATFPCLSCRHCNSCIKGDFVYHPHKGTAIKIKGATVWGSLVYAIKCPCGLMYVEKTTRQAKERIGEQKSDIKRKKIPRPRRGGDRVKQLLKCEASWIRKLVTLMPGGLNKEYKLKPLI
ncbi:hypothetical protein XELAEV_18027056mg [Xenopus laevis]|uniref:Uncharacterized protein n=1 Tax=Xenopus laevis TaxID=8355 RepID=A0A974CVI3_XENLA|nr:hypothetical protein XELAEV_18027056mg [Xenopus laevis]